MSILGENTHGAGHSHTASEGLNRAVTSSRSSVEQVAQEAFPAAVTATVAATAMTATAMAAAVATTMPVVVAVAVISAGLAEGALGNWRLGRGHLRHRRLVHAALDDLVQLAAIEPDTTALRAIVDFNALPLAHHKRDLAHRAREALVSGVIRHDTILFNRRVNFGILMPGEVKFGSFPPGCLHMDLDVRRPVLLGLMIVEVFVERDVAAAIAGVEGRQHEQGQQGG